MRTLADKLKLFPLATDRTLFLVLDGEEFGYAKGPVAPDEYPKEPLIGLYPAKHFLDELENHLDDLDSFTSQEKENILFNVKLHHRRHSPGPITDIKEEWWHQLDPSLQKWLLEYVTWRNGRALPEWFGPRPQCCVTATTMMKNTSNTFGMYPRPFIYLQQRWSSSHDSLVGDPLWWCNDVTITHCPFCGEKLPAVCVDKNPIGPIHRFDDGYCATCGERAHACECRPPSAMYRLAST